MNLIIFNLIKLILYILKFIYINWKNNPIFLYKFGKDTSIFYRKAFIILFEIF